MKEDKDPRDVLLLQAAQNGDWAEITRLRDQGIDINKTLKKGIFSLPVTVLSEASKYGHTRCVQKLAEGEAGVEPFDIHRYKKALEEAAVGGHLECLRFLVEHMLFNTSVDKLKYQIYIDLSKTGDFDQITKRLISVVDGSILHGWKGNNLMSLFVVYGCPPSCLQGLIDRGVEVNGYDHNGYTPLMSAVLADNGNCVRFLLGVGVDVKLTTISRPSHFIEDGSTSPTVPDLTDHGYVLGPTALMYAACLRNTECLNQLLQVCSRDDINFRETENMWSAVEFAAFHGNTKSVTLLMNDSCIYDDDSLLLPRYVQVHSAAITGGQAHVLEMTLEAETRDLRHMIHNSVSLIVSDVKCLEKFLKYINDLDGFVRGGHTYLTEASRLGRIDSVRLLLDRGAGIDTRNQSGTTALMASSDDKLKEVFDFLVEKGADVNIEDTNHRNAISYAVKNNAVGCLHDLIRLGANIDIKSEIGGETPLMVACSRGHTECVKLLIESGANVEAQNADDSEVVLHATNVDCLQLLVANGANIYSTNKAKQTALMLACERGLNKVVEFLLHQGMDINAQDETGKTAAMYAVPRDHAHCFKLLMNQGADLDLVDERGFTIFCFAMGGDRGRCLDLLLQDGKILCGSLLKPQHKHAMSLIKRVNGFHLNMFFSVISFNIFDWDWCLSQGHHGMKKIAFAAVLKSISPGKIKYDTIEVSLLILALLRGYTNVAYYLIFCRYLLPEDYKILSTDSALKDEIIKNNTGRPYFSKLLERFTNEPLSLQALSFLNVSKALSSVGSPPARLDAVDSLPIPVQFKKWLLFKHDGSRLCPNCWKEYFFEKLELFDFLNLKNKPLRPFTSCTDCRSCQGHGVVPEDLLNPTL